MERGQARTEGQITHYVVTGQVIPHRGRGRGLGVPTLNLAPPDTVPDGIYAGVVSSGLQRFPAAVFVGAAITFGETERQLEAHLLNADVDITGIITVELTHWIRDNQQFKDATALQQQMAADLITIQQCLQASSKNF